MKRTALLLTFLAAGCASTNRTDRMLRGYVGKPAVDFIKQRSLAPTIARTLPDGSQVYRFDTFNGGDVCRITLVTDPQGVIRSYRWEGC